MHNLGVIASILKTTDFVITRLDPITVPIEWIHHSDIAWASWHLKFRRTRLFAQQLPILRLTDENLKVQHYWPFVTEIYQWPMDSLCKGPVMWKTLSCRGITMLWSVLLPEFTLDFLHCWPFERGIHWIPLSKGQQWRKPSLVMTSILLQNLQWTSFKSDIHWLNSLPDPELNGALINLKGSQSAAMAAGLNYAWYYKWDQTGETALLSLIPWSSIGILVECRRQDKLWNQSSYCPQFLLIYEM